MVAEFGSVAHPLLLRTAIFLENRQAVSEPKIRAVEDQTSVETIRLKKYTIEEGHEEGNFVPFFPPECEGLQAEASRQEQTQHPDGLSQDPRQLLLDRHRALEEIERRQQEKEEEEVRGGFCRQVLQEQTREYGAVLCRCLD